MQMRPEPDLSTRAVRAGRADLSALGVHAPPIDLSSTYPFTDLDKATESLDALVSGEARAANPVYARLHNPTVARFEEGLAALENAAAAVAFSSGMAAMTAALLAARQNGTHVIATRPIYGTTDHLLTCEMLGLEVTWAQPSEIRGAIRPDTSLIIIETPANPTLALVDIADVVSQAGDVPVLVDSTFATPVLQRPLDHGATMVLHSATKFLGGHGDVIAGVIATCEPWAQRLRQVRILTGALLHPLAAYLLHRGLPTLPLRVERAQQSASILAHRLSRHPGVTKVHYPGVAGGDPQKLVGRQMDGPGTIVGFEVAGDHAAARSVLQYVTLMTPAVSLGSVDTLIQHPAGLTHRVVCEEGRTEGGISDALLRISVGLESPEDLWGDLSAALNRAHAHVVASADAV